MRPFILFPAVLVFATPAAAQGWQEYKYPDYSITVSFPADPQVETTAYRVGDDRTVTPASMPFVATTPSSR